MQSMPRMRNLSLFLGAALLAACGGSSNPGSDEPQRQLPDTVPEDQDVAHQDDAPEPFTAPPVDDELEPAPETDDVPAMPPAPEPVAAMVTASAELMNAKTGAAMGKVTFTDDKGTITITGEFTGLSKNKAHAFYVHENGDCSKGGKNVGGHLDPTHAKHGPPSSATRHAGDFGDLAADDSGNATFTMTTDSVTLEPGRADSVVGRAMVIHAKADDPKGTKAGAVLACGVIELD